MRYTIDSKVYCSVKHKNALKPCTCGVMPMISVDEKVWRVYCEECKRSLYGPRLTDVLKEWNNEQ